MTIRDLEDLLADIEVYSTYEQGANADYWRDITIVTEDELKKLQLIDKNSRGSNFNSSPSFILVYSLSIVKISMFLNVQTNSCENVFLLGIFQ